MRVSTLILAHLWTLRRLLSNSSVARLFWR
jgi:hypothetical protein